MDITIEKLIYGGEGLAHHDGATVFVPFVLPAERVAAAPVEKKKKFVRARVERLIEPAAERAVPRCPYFGTCGGCDYQHIPYEAQLRYKTDILRETLRRTGKIDWTGEITAHASPPWEYRNRAQWKVRPLGESAGESAQTAWGIGYFRARSAALCGVDQCAILSPLLQKTLAVLRQALADGTMPGTVRELEALANGGDSKLLMTATFSVFPAHAAELAQALREILPETESLLFHEPARERMELFGPGFVTYETGGRAHRVGHFSFFQVNRFLADELAREVTQNEQGDLALDLFAGVGLFSLPLAERFRKVVAVESNPAAARDLEYNALARMPDPAGERGQLEVRAADAEQFLGKFRQRPELVVLDPPRAGLTPRIIKELSRIAPARITYVSCDPPTLARDLGAFRTAGYELSEVQLFDLFPQTFHMEAVARLRRHP